MWFDSVNDVLRIVLVGTSGYTVLVLALRLSGRRTLAKLNAFDFVVTIAVTLQAVVAGASSRVPRLRGLVTAHPALLLLDGEPRVETMHRHRVGMDELHQAVRGSGTSDLGRVVPWSSRPTAPSAWSFSRNWETGPRCRTTDEVD